MKRFIFLFILSQTLHLIFSDFALAQTWILKGLDLPAETSGDKSGWSVSMPDVFTIAIGAPFNSGNGYHSGSVRIQTWNGSAWVQKGVDIDGEAANDEFGYSVSMPDANTVAIGAPMNDANGSNAGHVRVYSWNGSMWVQKGVDIDGLGGGFKCGFAVSMPTPNTLAVSSPYNNTTPWYGGLVSIYDWDGSTWVQRGSIIPGENPNDLSGSALCMPDANTVSIGSWYNNGYGHARVFYWNGSSWIQKGSDIDGEANNDHAGESISMPDANTIAVGAPNNDGNGTDAGHVRVYYWNGTSWQQKGADINGEAANDWSGFSVSMPDDNTLAIGAYRNSGTGTYSGHVRIYRWIGNSWNQIGSDINGAGTGDYLGYSVSMPVSSVVGVGAQSGHSQVYYICNIALSAAAQSNVTCTNGTDGAASVNPATGGAGGYTYDWSPGNPSGDGTISVTGLTQGIWTCTVTDANGCTATQTFSITNSDTQAPQFSNQLIYTDMCSNLPYTDGWQNGDNGGTGFSSWSLNASTGNTAQAGFTRSSSVTNGGAIDSNGDSDINSSGLAWGLYANSAQAVQAVRPFSSPLSIGRSFSLQLDNGNVDNGQIIGIQLQNNAGNSLGEIRYRGGQANYEIVDINGITAFTGIPWTDEGLKIMITPVASGQSTVSLTRKVNGVNQVLTMHHFAGGGDQVIKKVMVFNSNAGSGADKVLYVNHFSLSASPLVSGCPSDTLISTVAGCSPQVSYNTILALDNCSGATVTQTAGLPTGSVFPYGTTTNTFQAVDLAGNTNTCSFDVTIITPEIDIKGNGQSIINNDITPSTTDNTDFGSVSVCTGTRAHTFKVYNLGTEVLTLTGISITGTNASDFTLSGVPSMNHSIPPGDSLGFQVVFNPSAAALRTARLRINSNDCNENLYDIDIQGTGTDPEINVKGNNTNITNGDLTPSFTDHTDFGSVLVCTGTIVRTYTVENTGTATLNTSAISITGTHASDFSLLSTTLGGPMPPGGSGTVTIRFDATAVGLRSAMINIGNDDCNESPFSFAVQGTGNADVVSPVFTSCPGNSTVNAISGQCYAVVNFATPNATDNCTAGLTVTQIAGLPSGSNFPVGANTVTFRATDASGNFTDCSFQIDVIDNIAPTANCQNLTVYLSTSGSAGILPIQLDAGSSDACGIASRTLSQSTFTCANVGTNNVTLTVTDVNGNSSSCTSVVTVVDTVRPVANCINRTFMLNNTTGTLTIGGAWINNGSSDACGIASMTASPSTFTCANVGANNVTLTVTDVNGNSSVCTAVVTILDTMRPNVVTQNITVTLSNGTASITPAMINNGSSDVCGIASMTVSPNTFNCSNLGANTVTLTVTDVNGNTQTGTAVVTVLSDLATVVQINSNVNCFGGSNGQATAIVTGGAAPFSYSWTPSGGTNATATGLSAGVYTCTVTDNGGCQASAAVVITQPATPVSVSLVSQTNVSCNAGNNGSATVNATGGTPNYAYSWAPTGGNTSSATGLSAGTYTVTVTDNNNCSATQTVTITQPLALVASPAAQTNVSCNGGSNGTASVAVSGGTMTYSYNWTPGNPTGDGTASVIGLTAGTYTCTVTDANSCVATQTFNITAPSALVASVAAQTNVSCNGGNNGTAAVAVSGGTMTYSYNWTPGNPTGDGTASVFGLTDGTYTCTVTDANSCVTTQTFNITQPPVLTASAATQSNVSCFGGNNGSASVNATGGTPNYTYAWAPTGGNAATASGLSAGTYTCTVTDANSCVTTQTFNITQPPVLTASAATQTNVSCFGGNNGSATVNATGGTPNYTYSWAPTGGTAATASGLTAGTYTVTVTDANNCMTSQSFTIAEPTELIASSSSSTILCNGDTATVLITATGGTPGYTGAGSFYEVAGTYSYTVTDSNGCLSTTNVTITEPAAINVTITTTNVLCNGDSTGSIDLTVTGGTGSYTFDWNNGQYITEDLFNIPTGTYSGILTDANGCQDSGTIVITEPLPLQISSNTINPSGCTIDDGSISTTISGGTPGYTYLWNTGDTTATISSLADGTYSVTVTDTNSCVITSSFTLSDPAPPAVTFTTANDTVCQSTTTSFVLTGASPFGGLYSGSGVVNDTMFDPMAAIIGYNVITYTYTDTNGCSASAIDSIYVDLCLGISAATEELQVLIYPNPNNGNFTIQTTSYADVLIFDAQGKLVHAEKVQPHIGHQITIEASGMYLITVIDNQGRRNTQRVMVNK